jgi:hypothetical protein
LHSSLKNLYLASHVRHKNKGRQALSLWLERLSSLRVDAPLAMSDSDGRPVRFAKPGFVVELEAEDVLPAEDESGGQQVFGWNDSRWIFEGLAASPRLLLPTFHRLRPDKEFTPQAVPLEQLNGREISALELINRNLPGLEVVRRARSIPKKSRRR